MFMAGHRDVEQQKTTHVWIRHCLWQRWWWWWRRRNWSPNGNLSSANEQKQRKENETNKNALSMRVTFGYRWCCAEPVIFNAGEAKYTWCTNNAYLLNDSLKGVFVPVLLMEIWDIFIINIHIQCGASCIELSTFRLEISDEHVFDFDSMQTPGRLSYNGRWLQLLRFEWLAARSDFNCAESKQTIHSLIHSLKKTILHFHAQLPLPTFVRVQENVFLRCNEKSLIT